MDKKIKPSLFKSVLGSFTTGVTVITVKDIHGNPYGFTANSFTSVSLEPPLVLFCLHNDSQALEIFKNEQKCVINILHEEQSQISMNFAFNQDNKFENIHYSESINFKYPIIKSAISWLECVIENCYLAGDHHVFICRVIELARERSGNPLIYYSGEYRKIY